MLEVVPVKSFGIAKDRRGFLERNTVLSYVAESLCNIPREHISVYTLIRRLRQSTYGRVAGFARVR